MLTPWNPMDAVSRRGTTLAMALLGLLTGCGNPAMKACGAPRSGQGVRPAEFSLQGSPLETLSGAASSPSPRMLGGTLSLLGVDRVGQKNVAETKRAELRFVMPEVCSVSLEVRKEGDAYKIDAFTSNGCLMQKLVFRGSAPVLNVFRPAKEGLLHGYESFPVSVPELAKRESLLDALDTLPEFNESARLRFLGSGINSDRVPSARYALETPPAPKGLLKEMCLEVPAEVMDAWNAQPAATRGLSPKESSSPDPRSCQFLVDGDWFVFDVPATVAKEKKALLDELVAETAAYKAFRDETSGLDAALAAALADVRAKGRAAYEADMAWRRMQVAQYAVRADCAASAAQAKIFCGSQKEAYVQIAKTHLVPTEAALIDAAKAAGYAGDPVTKINDRVKALIAEGDKAFIAYAAALKVVQDAMKARRNLVGIATNHIRNIDATKISLVYKDLPLFPADGKLAEELSRHSFMFANAWLDMAFAKENAHPLVTNLRNEVNDGYAVTFAGYPVGALLADRDHSGGASVIALPTRHKGAAAEDRGKAEANTGKPATRTKRETTTTDGSAGGC